MNIAGMNRKDKVLIGLILILIGTLVVGSAALHARGAGKGISITTATLPTGGQVVASKSGSKYFLPWCGSVSRIKDTNKVWFASVEEAEAAGYQPAGNCKGL